VGNTENEKGRSPLKRLEGGTAREERVLLWIQATCWGTPNFGCMEISKGMHSEKKLAKGTFIPTGEGELTGSKCSASCKLVETTSFRGYTIK